MNILAINCGSSTLKFRLMELGGENVQLGQEQRLAHGTVDRIGGQGKIRFTIPRDEDCSQPVVIVDHGEAARRE